MNQVHPVVKRALAFIVAVVAVVAISQSFMKPAYAAWACANSSIVCFATNTSGGGNWYFTSGTPIETCKGVLSSFNDQISSLRNNYQSAQLNVYENNPCGGYVKTYPPNWIVNDVGWFWNDEISAFCVGQRKIGGCP